SPNHPTPSAGRDRQTQWSAPRVARTVVGLGTRSRRRSGRYGISPCTATGRLLRSGLARQQVTLPALAERGAHPSRSAVFAAPSRRVLPALCSCPTWQGYPSRVTVTPVPRSRWPPAPPRRTPAPALGRMPCTAMRGDRSHRMLRLWLAAHTEVPTSRGVRSQAVPRLWHLHARTRDPRTSPCVRTAHKRVDI